MREGSLGRIEAAAVSQAAGRDDALRLLAGRVAQRGYRIARDLLGDRAEAEDAVQEALARACASYSSLRDPAALDAWFFRILTNHCLRTLRRRRIFRVLGVGGGEAEAPPPSRAELADPAPRPDEGLDAAAVLAAVRELPAMQRAALTLRYGHDLAVAEIASMLGVELGTAKTHLTRGLERLRRSLDKGKTS